ncbi:MAG: hypothetical protein FWC61_01895 [Proteobacteria bacterium]|nr:hypothetical protein [Pseudomonadota bacterium]
MKIKLYICAIAVALCAAWPAFAAVSADYAAEMELANKTALRAALKAEIAQIDSEISRCNKAKTNWTAATVVGSVGVVGTGIGAIVQHNQIQSKKRELSDLRNSQ